MKPGQALISITFFLLFFFATASLLAQRQPPKENIRGVVLDKASQSPLPGANVTLPGTEPLLGAATDPDGRFLIPDVPAGRYTIQASYLGYKTLTLDNQMVTAGKELVLKIALEETGVQGQEVEIVAKQRKDQPVNPMALISARSFTIDETSRYAGSYGDPARMAANYAGVVSGRDNRNDIVIRGNAPYSLKYHIDGIEILNPNHFGATGTSGGPITILNTNLLANSDFLTGAFPAEYGNAISGIFDIHLRDGNLSRREYWAELGFNGLEFGLEGPFKLGGESSYLAAYRYSFTSLLEAMGVNLKESADYQDLSFKLHMPTKNAGTFSLVGMGGLSSIGLLESNKNPDEWLFPTHGEDLRTRSSLATLGLNHLYFINPNTRVISELSFVTSAIETTIDTFDLAVQPFRWGAENSQENKLTASVQLLKKLDSRNSLEIGANYEQYFVHYADSQYIHHEYHHYTDASQDMGLLQVYGSVEHHFLPRVTSTFGLHYQYLSLNGSWSLEPRLAFKWDLNDVNALSFGVGMHSQMVPTMLYFTQAEMPGGSYMQTNRDLDFMRSVHLILGYDLVATEHMRFKAEAYYQHLYRAPVKESIPEYSALNEGIDYYILRYDSLISHGSGLNYGLDLTLERFLHNNYYFLVTASLFRSYYWGYDDVRRSTTFDNRYVLNAVGGYELPLGKYKNRFLILGLRATWTGGRPYLPYDPEKTVAEGEVVYDWKNAYSDRFDDYIRGSLRIGFRRNVPRANFMLYFDLQYRSNYTYVDLYRIDVVTGDIVQGYQMGFYPMATWRVQF